MWCCDACFVYEHNCLDVLIFKKSTVDSLLVISKQVTATVVVES